MCQTGSVVILAGWICLVVLHPHEVAVEAGVSNFNPVVIQVPTRSDSQLTDRDLNIESKDGSQRTIRIDGDEFKLDGQPLHIVSGSVHYYRMPAQYWRDRLRKVKAAGLNAIATYVEWSFHEPEERQYRFEGDYDVAQFVRIAAEEGLLVLLRPGPYICAERDLGGLPYWLLSKFPHIRLRSTDEDFLEETGIWFEKLFERLTPLLYENGGPIILVQVENEYGSYGNDMVYKERLRDIIQEHVNNKALLYTTDGYDINMVRGGAVPGSLPTIDFGPGKDIRKVFRALRQILPQGPLMNSEYYPGWLTHWGETLQQVDKDVVVSSLRDMLDNKINVNIYVFFGGTNYEFSAGANYINQYRPDITSYDYDAPLNEAGDPTSKYYAIKELLESYDLNLKSIIPPIAAPKGAYGKVKMMPQINLLSESGRAQLGKPYRDVTGATLPTFEQLRQRAGLLLYETTLNNPKGILEIRKPRDRIYVYISGELKGIIDRMSKTYTLMLNSHLSTPGVLSLLVENQGRINYGTKLHDYKGILGYVRILVDTNSTVLADRWNITGYPLELITPSAAVPGTPSTKYGPVVYEANLILPEGQQPLDTFIDPTGWGKGYIWVNGHNLGRYWPGRGPQVTLYVPGVWLRAAPAHNTIQLLELERPASDLTVNFIDHPILNRTASDAHLANPDELIFNI